jgi:hypothetical protein
MGMSNKPHTVEPWSISAAPGWQDTIVDAKDNKIAVCSGRSESIPNAQRIVACVNACAGIEDPAETIKKARDVISGLLESLNVAIEKSEGDTFGKHHNDATDNMVAAAWLLITLNKATNR